MIADAASEMMLKCELQEPDGDVIVSLAEEFREGMRQFMQGGE